MIGKIVLGTVLGLFCAPPAFAAGMDATSLKQMHDYVLTMPKVQAYEAAYTALTAAAKADASLKADYQAASEEKTKTLADEIAKMTHHPRVYAYFSKQGLSKEDAVILPMALMGGCMVAQYPSAAAKLAAQTSAQQGDFCKQNMAAVNKLHFVSGK